MPPDDTLKNPPPPSRSPIPTTFSSARAARPDSASAARRSGRRTGTRSTASSAAPRSFRRDRARSSCT